MQEPKIKSAISHSLVDLRLERGEGTNFLATILLGSAETVQLFSIFYTRQKRKKIGFQENEDAKKGLFEDR